MNIFNKNINNKVSLNCPKETCNNTNLLSVLILIMHLIYFLYYFFNKSNFFLFLNLFSIIIIGISILINKKNYYDISINIISMDIIIYSIISSSLIGLLSANFLMISIVLISHFIFFHENKTRKIFYSIISFISYNFIIIWLFFIDPTFSRLNSSLLATININIFVIFLLIILYKMSITKTLIKNNFEKKLLNAKRESFTDTLTNVWNRRFLDEIKNDLMTRAKNGDTISIGMLDIDDFKLFNDSYEHDFGDQVLKELIQSMILSLRNDDIVIRYGGEEFIIIMIDTDEYNAYKLIDNFRVYINKNPIIKFKNKDILIKFTCGISSLNKFDNFNDALQVADRRMYLGKSTGKNKVVYQDNI